MPHARYHGTSILCPWPNGGFVIAMIDFQLERGADQDLYNRVVLAWGYRDGFGVIGRCPGCGHNVLFTDITKTAIENPDDHSFPCLPDDWHNRAFVSSDTE